MRRRRICFQAPLFYSTTGCYWVLSFLIAMTATTRTVDAFTTPTPPATTTKPDTLPSSPYKAILFDIDGTLADSFQLGFDATATVLSNHDIPAITAKIYHDHTIYPTPDRLARHAGLLPGDDDYERVGAMLAQEFDDLYIGLVTTQTAGFYDGIQGMLDKIPKQHVALGALTNAAARYAHAVLTVNSHAADPGNPTVLYQRFGAIRGADDVPKAKPAPDGLWTVLQDLGMDASAASSCVYVGDSPSDAKAAKAAGMAAIGVLWGSHSEQTLQEAPFDVLCATVPELERCLLLQESPTSPQQVDASKSDGVAAKSI